MKKKILVMYARYGSGHKSIAENIAKYLKEHNENYEILLLDMTEYGNFVGRAGIKVMNFVCRYRPELIFDFCYEMMDHKISTLGHNQFSKQSYDNNRLRNKIKSFNPDITISTHFYCSNIINYYNKINLINSKLFTVITDYRTHECWIRNHKEEDGFIVGNEIVKKELIKRGVSSKKIYVFGLPLNISKIRKLDSNEKIYKRYNISKNKKVYLFFGGSTAGSMYYYEYFKAICKSNINANVIFISGKNNKLKIRCEHYVRSKNIKNIVVLGFTNDVFNIMKISDLVISKPGGATITESMEMKVPMVLVPGVGGQEKYNARFITYKKYGMRVRGPRRFKKMIEKLDSNPIILQKMKERLEKLDNNKSIEKINNLITKL